MSDTVRTRIFDRLQKALVDEPIVKMPPPEAPPSFGAKERVSRFTELMEAVRTEVYQVQRDVWLSKLTEIIQAKKIDTLLYGPGTWLASELEKSGQKGLLEMTRLRPYSEEVESFKKELFDIDAGITTTMGAVADRGALILWPTQREPRLISLVPPIHIAVVDAKAIYGSLSEAMEEQNWSQGMPTNALLVSGTIQDGRYRVYAYFWCSWA